MQARKGTNLRIQLMPSLRTQQQMAELLKNEEKPVSLLVF